MNVDAWNGKQDDVRAAFCQPEEAETLGTRIWSLAQVPTLMLTNQSEFSDGELKPFPERLYVVLSGVANEET